MDKVTRDGDRDVNGTEARDAPVPKLQEEFSQDKANGSPCSPVCLCLLYTPIEGNRGVCATGCRRLEGWIGVVDDV